MAPSQQRTHRSQAGVALAGAVEAGGIGQLAIHNQHGGRLSARGGQPVGGAGRAAAGIHHQVGIQAAAVFEKHACMAAEAGTEGRAGGIWVSEAAAGR